MQVEYERGGRVSLFRNYFDKIPSESISIETFLSGFSASKKSWVEKVRTCQDLDQQKKMKLRLPAITPAGVFTVRRKNCIREYSGYAGIDLDNLDGKTDEVKERIRNFPGLAYCGLSVRGNGLFALIRLAYPGQYDAQLRSLYYDFTKIGLTPDPACKDVCRLRFVSYDPNPIVNFTVSPYSGMIDDEFSDKGSRQSAHDDAIAKRVERCIRQIMDRQLDITSRYEDWLALGYALGNQFGEGGREYFHQISQYYPKYDRREADRTFSACLKGNAVTIGTFFFHSKKHGIYW